MGLAHSPSIISDGLVFYLDAANTRSYSGSGLTVNGLVGGIGGTLYNGVVYASTPTPNFDFDGANDYIGFPKLDALSGKTAFTFSVFCSRENGTLVINQGVSYPESTFLSLYSSTVYFSVSANSGSQSYGYFYNDNTGYRNIVAVFDGTQTGNSNRLKLYENGILQTIDFGGGAIPNITSTTGDEFEIGAIKYLSAYTPSSLSAIQIYNRALSATEILQNYNATRKRFGL
jgi:hypothetical protein